MKLPERFVDIEYILMKGDYTTKLVNSIRATDRESGKTIDIRGRTANSLTAACMHFKESCKDGGNYNYLPILINITSPSTITQPKGTTMTGTTTSVFETDNIRIQQSIDNGIIPFIQQANIAKIRDIISDYKNNTYSTLELLGKAYKVSRTQMANILKELGVYTARKSPTVPGTLSFPTKTQAEIEAAKMLQVLKDYHITSATQLSNVIQFILESTVSAEKLATALGSK